MHNSLQEIRSMDVLAAQKIAPLPQKLTQKDTVKWNPVTATMAKYAELHLWIHTLDMLLSG